jgi:hypothetical protein
MVSTKRPNNHETLSMTLAMLDMIPKTGKISAPEIHARLHTMGFERDLRSIQRQLVVLAEQFPLECDDSSKPHGYKWKSDAKGISIPSLTLHESLLLNMAENYLRNLLPQSVMRAMDGFFRQARYDLGPGTPNAGRERRWLRKVRVVSESMPLLPPEIKPGVLEAVSQALYKETWLELDYTNAKGERSQHRVMPLGLAQQGARLVLVVRYEGYDNERSLALNRAHNATDTGLPFPPIKNFDLAQYDDDGRFGFGSGKTIQLKFRIENATGLFLTESRLSKDQTVVDLGEKLEFTATVVESARLVWWLRGFGKRVEVLEPVGVRERVVGV